MVRRLIAVKRASGCDKAPQRCGYGRSAVLARSAP